MQKSGETKIGKQNREKILNLLESAPELSFSVSQVSLIVGLSLRACRMHLQTMEDWGKIESKIEKRIIKNGNRVSLVKFHALSAPSSPDSADPG
jgi:predicted transcriptional regulator